MRVWALPGSTHTRCTWVSLLVLQIFFARVVVISTAVGRLHDQRLDMSDTHQLCNASKPAIKSVQNTA